MNAKIWKLKTPIELNNLDIHNNTVNKKNNKKTQTTCVFL